MGGLPRPEIPPGARRELVDALHDLHHRAGWPSLRTLAKQAGCSHTTVSATFSSPKLPSWGVLELLVEAMDGDVDFFRHLWLGATTPSTEGHAAAVTIAGRRAELAACRRQLETGTGLLLVLGEAGMGKTRLVTTAARTDDRFVARADCLPLSTEAPMMPVADLLRSVYDVDGGQWLEKALSECPDYVPASLSRLLPELAPWSDGAGDDDEWARERLFSAVRTALTSLANQRPLALVVEDLHWADSSTLDLLEHLFSRGPGVPIVGTFRVDDPATSPAAEEWRARIARRPQVEILELGPLTISDTAEQLSLLLGRVADDALVQRIHRRAQGQPLFAEQLCAHTGRDQRLPRLLAELLDQRLDAISETATRATAALGVADRSLTDVQLQEVTGLSLSELTDALHELDRAHLLGSTSGSREIRLRHPLLAEAIRRRLLGGEAVELHRRLAELLSRGSGPASEVAAHWQAADDHDEELVWRVRAAREATDRHAVAQQAEHWLRALDLWPDSPTTEIVESLSRAQVSLNAMESLRDSGQMPRALELAERAMPWLPEMTPQEAADLYYRAGYYRGEAKSSMAGIELLEQAIALYEQMPPGRGLASALEVKGLELASVGRREEARANLQRLLEVCEQVGDPRLTFGMMPTVAWHEAMAGDLDGALQRIELARAECASPSPLTELWMGVCHTDILLVHGRPVAEIEAAAAPALEAARSWRIENSHSAIVHANVAEAMLRAGQVERAAALLDPVTEDALVLDHWFAHLVRAWLDVLRGRATEAAERVSALDEVGLTWHVHEAARATTAALADVWRGEAGPALDRLLGVLQPILPTHESEYVGGCFVLAARAAADSADGTRHSGAREARLRALEELRARAHRDPLSPEAVPADHTAQRASWDAELARLCRTATVEHWAAAAVEWDRLARPHDAAYCRWRGAQVALATQQAGLAAKLLRRAGRDAREHVPLLTSIRRTAEAARQGPGA